MAIRKGTTVAIVDDHTLLRTGLALLLEQSGAITVVAQGSTSPEALSIATGVGPQVMLLDVEIDRISTESTIRQLTRLAPDMKIIILTMHRDSILRRQLLRAGATDYVTKDVPAVELLERIRLSLQRRAKTPLAPTDESQTPAILSERELQVLRMIGQARSNRAIASQLSIAEGTVKRHTTHIYAKLGAASRIDAVRKATRLGLF